MKPVIAKYMRISNEDIDLSGKGKRESNSVTNQRALLDDFIAANPEFAAYEVVEFFDDGWSGTNFSRPSAHRLIKAAQSGGIQCIVVKDITRWGRNYLEVGDFLEQKFPAWGVRFISLGDMYDSANTIGGLGIAFSGLIAQMYSQDLSEKIRSAKDAACRKGKIITGCPTYGYAKDKNNRCKFVINPQEASMVKRIYGLAAQGFRVAEIVRRLNADSDNRLWGKTAVRLILRDERYVGKWIYGKTRVVETGSRRAEPVPRSEWIIIEGAIPAIITEEQFAKVQEVLKKHSKKRSAAPAAKNNLPEKETACNNTSQPNNKKANILKMALWEDFNSGNITREVFCDKNKKLSEQTT
jgi:DNA invertase Pin-like site-specific DNA recombinase